MSKVIFLDVDGVLNDVQTDERSPDGFIGIDPLMVGHLKFVVDQTGANVVLTSTWKSEWDRDSSKRSDDGNYLHDTLLAQGVEIIDKTEDQVADRGHGIIRYLEAHPEIEKWIVLDDEVYFDFKECGIMEHLIRSRYAFGGLTNELANHAVFKLNAAA